jgi:hypothetical protein
MVLRRNAAKYAKINVGFSIWSNIDYLAQIVSYIMII